MFKWLRKLFGLSSTDRRRRRSSRSVQRLQPQVSVRRRVASGSPVSPSQRNAESAVLGLRNQALQGTPTAFGLEAPSSPTQPWGVLMETGFPEGWYSLVALSDGSASIYLSSGGGSIGGAG